jgi:hypothetical protein
MTFRFWVCAVLGTIVLTGCGGSGPKLVPVEGAVTLDGKPLANKTVMFTPIDDTSGHGAGGVSGAEGKYTLTAVVPGATRDHQGLAPGRYRVTVYEGMISGDGSGEEEGDEPVAAIAPDMGGRMSEIPTIYSTEQSPLVLEVPESGGTLNVELKSNPGG